MSESNPDLLSVHPDLISVEAEQAILGTVLLWNEHADALGFLRANHFYDGLHGAIWRNICERLANGQMVSPVTMAADFAGHEGLGAVGGAKYLARLGGASVDGPTAVSYARMLVELTDRRNLVDSMAEIRDGVYKGWDAAKAAAALELALHEREDNTTAPRAMSFLKAQTEALERMVEIQQGADPGVPSGIASLDEMLSLGPKRYTILGGSTSMGKSALAIWLSYAAAKRGHGVGFVSLEMGEADIANRMNAIESQIPYRAYDRRMSETLMRRVVTSAKDMEALPIQIFNNRVRDVPSILSEGQRLKRHWAPNGDFKGLRLLVVDYLQLVQGRGESAFVRLSQVANDLKQVAKTLDVHVLALAQVDRGLSKASHWTEARPRLADLRGSGDLENAPDNVIFAFRPEYYFDRATPPKKTEELVDWEAERARWKGKMEIIIGKARMGEIGSTTVGCDMATNRFWNLDDQLEVEF